MRTTRLLLLSLLCLVLFSGCAPLSSSIKPVNDQTSRRDYLGFSILPPQGANWYLIQEDQGTIAFAKGAGSQPHTFAAAVFIAKILPVWKTPNEFTESVKKGRRADTDETRYKILQEDYDLDNKFGQYCVRYHTIVADHGVIPAEGPPFMILEAYGYCCMHPKETGMYYDVNYSERYKPGESDPSLKPIGEEFINNFRFEDIVK